MANVIVYPNPNSGKFTVLLNEYAHQNGRQIRVTDIAGRKLFDMNIEQRKYSYTLNIDDSKGIYIVQILNGNKKL
ncbi:MAG: T9SS type A sorting domain-containing protein [Bacteroidetes bacterium]|nr:T9SS type A sorting domain-containing protein [Bacteroidota bacterium]